MTFSENNVRKNTADSENANPDCCDGSAGTAAKRVNCSPPGSVPLTDGFLDREYFKLKIHQLPEISSVKEV